MNVPFPKPLTDRELRWLRHIAVHGPQSSEFLLELCADTHACRDTGKRALQRLREDKWLRLPPQQRQIAKADFNPYVYDLTPKASLHLTGLGDPETVRPTGHWWHAFLTASITSAISIEAKRRGYRYIPAHEILDRQGATLAIPVGRRRLIPDQLFAIDYGGRFRSFVLEVDRGTEPYRSKAASKSLSGMIAAYSTVFSNGSLRKHYGLKSPLLFAVCTLNELRRTSLVNMIESSSASLSQVSVTKTCRVGFPRYGDIVKVIAEPWWRTRDEQFSLL